MTDDRLACRCDPALADALTQTWRHWRRLLADAVRPLGLTPAQARALRAIGAAGPVRMADLATELDVVPRSATSVVDALADAGLVVRSADTADRRSVMVSATARGRLLVERLDAARRHAAARLFAGLGAAEREQLLALLQGVGSGSRPSGHRAEAAAVQPHAATPPAVRPAETVPDGAEPAGAVP